MARVPSLDADRAVDHIVRSMKLMKRFYSWWLLTGCAFNPRSIQELINECIKG
jgi:hypothetical protein